MNNRWWPSVVWLAGGLLLAAALRYGILEDTAQDLLCRQGGGGVGCGLRSALGVSIHYRVFGLAGLALGLAGWWPKQRWAAFGGLLLSGCGLMLYNATFGAVAAVVSLLAALQPVSRSR